MDRRHFLYSVPAIALSGCSGIWGGTAPISEQFQCENAHRPGIDSQYPTKPETFNDDNIVTYVKNHEGEFLRQDIKQRVGEDLDTVQLSFDDVYVREMRRSIYIVRADLMLGYSTNGNENHSTVGSAPHAAVYAIDKSGMVRIEADHKDVRSQSDPTPEPLENGEIVECFR